MIVATILACTLLAGEQPPRVQVIVATTPGCAPCAVAKRELAGMAGVEFRDLSRAENAEFLKEHDVKFVPQVFYMVRGADGKYELMERHYRYFGKRRVENSVRELGGKP